MHQIKRLHISEQSHQIEAHGRARTWSIQEFDCPTLFSAHLTLNHLARVLQLSFSHFTFDSPAALVTCFNFFFHSVWPAHILFNRFFLVHFESFHKLRRKKCPAFFIFEVFSTFVGFQLKIRRVWTNVEKKYHRSPILSFHGLFKNNRTENGD